MTNEISYNLTGHVRHQGLPVSRIRVALFQVYSTELQKHATKLLSAQLTGACGEFTFDVKWGSYFIAVLPGNESRFLNHYSEVVTVDSNIAFTINLVTGYVLSGNVRTAAGGKFSAGSIVALTATANNYRAQSDVTSDGRYTLTVPRGKAILAYIASKSEVSSCDTANGEKITSIFPSTPPEETSQSITHSCFRLEVTGDQMLDLVFPALVETVYAVVDNNDQPLPNASISLEPHLEDDAGREWGFDLRARCQTDESGVASFSVEPGGYRLTIDPEEGSAFFPYREEKLAVSESAKKTIRLAPGFRLRGQVNHAGKPQPRCAVSLFSAVNQFHVRLETNGDGRFSAVLPGGTYRIAVAVGARQCHALPRDESPAPWVRSIVVGGDTQIAVTLKEGVSLSGTVTCASGQPRVGVRVFVFEKGATLFQNPEIADAITSSVTDDCGLYRFNLLPGTYQLVVHRDYENAQEVSVAQEGSIVNLTWTGWSQVKFAVQDEAKNPVPYCRLRCFPYSRDGDDAEPFTPDRFLLADDRLTTNDQGVCQITLPSGLYSFEFLPGKDSNYAPRLIRQLSVNCDHVRKITLNSAFASPTGSVGSGTLL